MTPSPIIRRPGRLTIPAAGLGLAVVATAGVGGISAHAEIYTVQEGDTISSVAQKTGRDVHQLLQANGLEATDLIQPGQQLSLPTPGDVPNFEQTTGAGTGGSYTVAVGDSLWSIANSRGVSAAAIMEANGLDSDARIMPGQQLTIPVGTAPKATTSTPAGMGYVVKSGDTVSHIAAATGTSIEAIIQANGLGADARIMPGQQLSIPATSPAGPVAQAAAINAQAAPADNASGSDVQAMVRSTAISMGVDPSLAQAVAFQESGFDQSAVSEANALGTMQVLPSSGEWASELVGRQLDLLQTQDNITAGVAILRSLLQSTGGDEATAIAGYYQGLSGVQQRGLYDDTRIYVANVQTLKLQFS